LEKVKAKSHLFDYRLVKAQLVDVCMNETGSFKIQEIFNNGAYTEKIEIFEEIKDHFPAMMIDRFGN